MEQHEILHPLDDALRRYDPVTRQLVLSDLLPRESRGFQLAFQLMLLEARDVVETLLTEMEPSTREARTFLQIGLTNYAAAAVLMPYMAFLKMAVANRYDLEVLSFRFGVSYQQAAQRLASLQRPGARGVPFFFVRTDPAGNISKSFSACGFPIPRQGNPCPQWNACTAFTTLGQIKTQIVAFTTGQSFLSIAKSSMGMAQRWGDARPIRTITIGCDLSRAREVVYSDHLNLDARPTSIGISCHLCDWEDCRSRAFPPLNHRLIPDINERVLRPIPFEGP